MTDLTETLSLRLTEDEKKQLEEEAKDQGRTLANMARWAILRYLEWVTDQRVCEALKGSGQQ